jgi:hypothetical protein
MNKLRTIAAVFLLTTSATTVSAQSPSDTYRAYIKSVKQSKSWPDVFPLMSASQITKMRDMPAKQLKGMHGFFQSVVRDWRDIKVVSEKKDGKTATVISSYCSEGKEGQATTSLVFEDGKWRVAKTNSSGSLKPCRIAQSPGDTYLAFNEALKRSTSWDELLPLVIAKDAAPIRTMPSEQRKRLHEFFRSTAVDKQNIKIVSEKITGGDAIVVATFCEDGRVNNEAMPLSLEGGSWKVGKSTTEGLLTSCRIVQTPSAAYLAFIRAVGRSSSWADLLPLLIAKNAVPIRAMPFEKSRDLHEFFQSLIVNRTELKVVSEKTTGKNSAVVATYCEDGKQGKETTPLLLENGMWGVGKGNSELSLKPCGKQTATVTTAPIKKITTITSVEKKYVKKRVSKKRKKAGRKSRKRRTAKRRVSRKRTIRKKRARGRKACGGAFMYRKGRKCVDARL